MFKTLTVLLALIVGIGAGEIVLRLLTPFPVTHISNKRTDAKLGYVMDSAFKDIDERGFRNIGVKLETADIVLIGDSFTYGFNVSLEGSLPSVLSRKTGLDVYNMGIGGYGIYHYATLLEVAKEYGVQNVIVALYPANDLKDYPCGWLRGNYWRARARQDGVTLPACQPEPPRNRGIAHWLSNAIKNTATGSAVRYVVYRPARNAYKKWLGESGDGYFRIGNQIMDRAWLTDAPMDYFADPTHVLNFENSKVFFASAASEYRELGIGLGFIAIPSPALIFTAWGRENGIDVEQDVSARADAEAEVVDRYRAFFEAEGIPFVETLPYVLKTFDAEVSAGRDFHPVADVHPYEAGYQAYADAAIEGLRLADKSEWAQRMR